MKFFKILIITIFLLAPTFAFADEEVKFTPQVGIPGSDFKTGSEYAMTGDTQPIGEYISSIYSYAVAIVGILAACTLILGGLLWLTAGGSAERVTSAKSWIGSSLTGLLLVICSYLLLSMVNPNLVKFQISGIEKPKKITSSMVGCCQYPEGSNPPCGNASETDCSNPYTWGDNSAKGDSAWYNSDYGCYVGKCQPLKKNGEKAIASTACYPGLKFVIINGDGYCTDGNNGSPCSSGNDCGCTEASRNCTGNKCDCTCWYYTYFSLITLQEGTSLCFSSQATCEISKNSPGFSHVSGCFRKY
jgi:hypothetical protein